MTKATATLSDHKSTPMTRAQLDRLPKPPTTGPYHQPIAHGELLDVLESQLKSQLDAKIESESYAVAGGGQKLFGVLTLSYGGSKDMSAALGLRHANDRTLAMQFVAGMSVFVCDNLALRGDLIVLKKRHTTNVDFKEEIRLSLDRYKDHVKAIAGEVRELKDAKLDDNAAKALILDAFVRSSVMPLRMIGDVTREWNEPRHREFEPRTRWSLHNAFTEVAKKLPMRPRLDATQRLGKLFGLTGNEA